MVHLFRSFKSDSKQIRCSSDISRYSLTFYPIQVQKYFLVDVHVTKSITRIDSKSQQTVWVARIVYTVISYLHNHLKIHLIISKQDKRNESWLYGNFISWIKAKSDYVNRHKTLQLTYMNKALWVRQYRTRLELFDAFIEHLSEKLIKM